MNTVAKALNVFELMEEMGQDQCFIHDFGIILRVKKELTGF